MPDNVTANEIAKRLGVTGLAFRNWLRDQNANGHPLVADHEHGTHYRFTPAEAYQLAEEFTAGTSAHPVTNTAPSASPTPRRRATPASKPKKPQKEHPRSPYAGHRVTSEWLGEAVETLDDLLRPGLRAVTIGINPAPASVAAGHYYQGRYGQRFFRRLALAGLLPDGDGYQDDRAFAAGIGFTDVVKRPTPGAADLQPGELEHGRDLLETKLSRLDVPLIIFVFKSSAETLLGPLPPGQYGLLPRRNLGSSRLFVMPGPTARTDIETEAVKRLKQAIGTV